MGAAELAIHDLDFEASAQLDTSTPPTGRVQLTGNADGAIVPQLTALIADVHKRLVEDHVREVTVDIRGVEFMNASCFNVLVAWINLINELSPDERYVLRFSINPAIPWQRRSLRTLSCFATDLVQVVD